MTEHDDTLLVNDIWVTVHANIRHSAREKVASALLSIFSDFGFRGLEETEMFYDSGLPCGSFPDQDGDLQ